MQTRREQRVAQSHGLWFPVAIFAVWRAIQLGLHLVFDGAGVNGAFQWDGGAYQRILVSGYRSPYVAAQALIGRVAAQGAEVDTVLPYVYDAQAADANIVTAIDEMAQGRVDAIALTSSGQVRRLFEVAQAHNCEAQLREGLVHTPIASVGPVVSDELKCPT